MSAAAVRMSVVGQMTQSISKELSVVRRDLDQTTASIERAKAADRDYAAINEVFAKARSRAANAQADANEKAAEARRNAVAAARESKAAAAQTDLQRGALDRLGGGIQTASRFQEGFNKVLGLAGFVGIAVGAVMGLSDLAKGATTYGSELLQIEKTQQRFNTLLEQVQGANRKKQLEEMSTNEERRAVAQEAHNKAVDDYRELQDEVWRREVVLAANRQMQARLQQRDVSLVFDTNVKGMRELQEEERKLNYERAQAQSALDARQKELLNLARQATPVYWGHVDAAKALTDEAIRTSNAAQSAIALAFKAAKDARGDANKPRGGGGGPTQAEKIRDLRAQLAVAQASTDEDRLQVEYSAALAKIEDDRARKKISAAERELKIQVESARYAKQIADIDKAKAEKDTERERETADRKQAVRDELALIGVKSEAKRREIEAAQELARINRQLQRGEIGGEEARLQRNLVERRKEEEKRVELLEEQGRRIERMGQLARQTAPAIGALDARLGGLVERVADMSGEWSAYAQGQQSLGKTVASSLGVMGQAVAGAIKDKRAQAAVEAGFEAAAAVASFAAYDYPAGIQHTVAAGAFTAVAAGAGGGGGSRRPAGGGASRGGPSASTPRDTVSSSSRANNAPSVTIVQFNRGIVYGMASDVGKASASANRSLRGTGMQSRSY